MLISQALDSVRSLETLLSSMATQPNLPSYSDLASRQQLAVRSRQLTTKFLNQIESQSNTSMTARSQGSGLVSYKSSSRGVQPTTVGRSQLNSQDICRNALRLRKNESSSILAIQTTVDGSPGWRCLACGATMIKATTGLSSTNADTIWIDEEGLFKAHCSSVSGRPPAWTCIWPVRSTSCTDSRFDSERALLQHMKDHHIFVSRSVSDFRLQWPADLCHRTAKACGFGAQVEGRDADDRNFVDFLD